MSNDISGGQNGYEDATDHVDPLENYDPKRYNDPLEHALAEKTVKAIQFQPYVSVTPETTIEEMLQKLVELDVACTLVEEEGRLVGLFSARDVMNKVALEYDQIKDRPVSEMMTTDPIYVYGTDSSAAALSVMAATGFRHVPVVDLDEKLIGIIGPLRVTRFIQEQYDRFADGKGPSSVSEGRRDE